MALTLREVNLLDNPHPQYIAMSGGLVIGYICRTSDRFGRGWSWSIFGVNAGTAVMETKGTLETFEEAKARLDTNWEKWLAWAKLAGPN